MYLHVNIIISLLISVGFFFEGGGGREGLGRWLVRLFWRGWNSLMGKASNMIFFLLRWWYKWEGECPKTQGVLRTNWDPAAGMLCLNLFYKLASLGDGHQYITAFLFCSQPELANLGSSSEFGPRSLVTQDPCSSASAFQLLPMCCAGTHQAYTEVHKSTQKRLQML